VEAYHGHHAPITKLSQELYVFTFTSRPERSLHVKVKPKGSLITCLHVRVISARGQRGRLTGPGFSVPCAIGRCGISARKREGDGASPRGTLPILEGFYRPDKFAVRPRSALLLRRLRRGDGWCDASGDRNYNRPVSTGYGASHESLWREDELYDVVLVLDHNVTRRRQGRGSAIFFHLSCADFSPTAGCVAVRHSDMLNILGRLARRAKIVFS
jgi:L,D-peptidoglycan transpeptidase YkuD (ErfK/YbiS/YcfS/YnhG family)